MEIKRGSEWRRWELHLHTPFTKKSDHFSGETSEEKWDNFYASIANYIGDGSNPLRSICAIAVTDYLSIDNYSKVCMDSETEAERHGGDDYLLINSPIVSKTEL